MTVKTNTKKYLVNKKSNFSLSKFNTTYNGHLGKADGKLELERVKQDLSLHQESLYASNSHSLLIIFQAFA